MAITESVFSEAEVLEIGIKIEGESKAVVNKCVGSAEEEMEVKTVVKKCRGKVVKSRTRGTGNGTLKLILHMQQDLFAKMHGMERKTLKDGIIAYGENSLHAVSCITVKIIDEDGNVKYKAYPKCSIQSALSRKIENGSEEITEIELEVAVMPDENGEGMYEAVATDVIDETIKTKWMSEFNYELIKKGEL